MFRLCKTPTTTITITDDLLNVLVEDGTDAPGGPDGASGGLAVKPVLSKEQLQVLIAMCCGFPLNSQISDLSILLNSSQFSSILLQVEKSAKSRQGPVSTEKPSNWWKKTPLSENIPMTLLKPQKTQKKLLPDDDLFGTRATTKPPTAAAGILLFSPDSPNVSPILFLYYVLF